MPHRHRAPAQAEDLHPGDCNGWQCRGAQAVDGENHVSPRGDLVSEIGVVAGEAATAMQHNHRWVGCGGGTAAEIGWQTMIRRRAR